MLTFLGSKASHADIYWITTAFLLIYACHIVLYFLLPYLVVIIMDKQVCGHT